jgi:predicted RNase H-like HicB family nuclease
MLTDYIRAAMRRAIYKQYPEDGSYWGEIPGFQGVWANTETLESCRDELQEVLEEWILFRLSKQLPLPVVDGIDLTIKKAV